MSSATQSTPWRLAQPPSQRKLGLTDAPVVKPFYIQYQPQSLAEVLGQEAATMPLMEFVKAPCPRAFLLSGPTGLGKTTCAMALAADLGVDTFDRIRNDQAWSFHWVRSGTADLAETESIMEDLRHVPMGGNWRVVLVDEADQITPRARQVWLSMLESIPAKTVIIWTTNRPEKFKQRDLDRFKHYEFKADTEQALAMAQTLADDIWRAETGGEDGPDVARLPNAILGGQVSYRRIASAMESLIKFGSPLCSAPDASGAPMIPPVSTPPPDAVAIAAPREPRVAREPRVKAPVATSPESWWNALGAPERVAALKRVPMASIPFEKVRERVQELIRRGSPPEYARYLNMQPVIVAAWGASQ